MKNVKIIGAGGYGGVGITELLLQHPEFKIGCLVAATETGMKMSDLYPHLKGFCDELIRTPDDPKAQESYDAVFFSTPDGVGMQTAAHELAKGAHVVDYSGDFRFTTPEKYSAYANFIGKNPVHAAPELLPQTVYGLSELHPFGKKQKLAGNPGCFAVSCILGLAPAAAEKLIDPKSVICDCKTGVSGAGKKPAATFHYPLRYENMNAYKIAAHQHNIEVEREITLIAGRETRVTLTTQVVPICRGIMSVIYARMKNSAATAKDVYECYQSFYAGSKFVRVEPMGVAVGNNDVRGSNFCVLSANMDVRTGQMIVVSHIDNLMKGQAGSALQNMNIMFGLDESLGLMRPPYYP